MYTESGAQVRTATVSPANEDQASVLNVQCVSGGTAANHIQISKTGLQIKEGDYYEFAFRVRCSKPFAISSVSLMKASAPWSNYGHGDSPRIRVGTDWTEGVVRYRATRSDDDARITIFVGGVLPAVRRSRSSRCPGSTSVHDHRGTRGRRRQHPLRSRHVGRRQEVESPEDLKPGRLLVSRRHLAGEAGCGAEPRPSSSERRAWRCGGTSWTSRATRAMSYTRVWPSAMAPSHGLGGSNTHHIVIRDCDVAWIGGGHQFTGPDGKPIRFGNGIEFWENAYDNLVEGCRIWGSTMPRSPTRAARIIPRSTSRTATTSSGIPNTRSSTGIVGPNDHAKHPLRAQHLRQRRPGLGPRPARIPTAATSCFTSIRPEPPSFRCARTSSATRRKAACAWTMTGPRGFASTATAGFRRRVCS